MGHQPTKSVEDKVRIVLAVLRGEISIAEAARLWGRPSRRGQRRLPQSQ